MSSGGAVEAGAVERLGVVVAGEHAEADRRAGVERDPGQAVGGGGADVVEVRRAAADDDAERDHGVVGARPARRPRPAARRCPARAPRSPRHGVRREGAAGAVEQAVHDLGVPPGGDHADAEVAAVDRLVGRGAVPAHRATPGSRRRPGRSGMAVAHPVALGAQVAQVVRVGPRRERHLGVDRDPEVRPAPRTSRGCWSAAARAVTPRSRSTCDAAP